ncbi:MAG: hypothetical protein V4627_12715 [Pseudomonadota bacterium]
MYPSNSLSAEQRADLHTRARRQARHLRQVAGARFWHSVHEHMAQALHAAWGLLHRSTRAQTPMPTPARKPSGV